MELSLYARTLGIIADETEEGSVCRMQYSPALLGSTTLHGGTIAALLKTAAVLEVARRHGDQRPALISLTTRFLRPGRQEDTFARAVISRKGARVVNVEVAAWQDDPSRPIASAQALFVAE
jgi:acyl-coenzyme A thioesterase PaaI-like protein